MTQKDEVRCAACDEVRCAACGKVFANEKSFKRHIHRCPKRTP